MIVSTLKINISNIVKNYKAVRTYVGDEVSVASMVKCNCYGLGMNYIVEKLFQAGCREFYVSNLSEAINLRKLLKTAEIYVLNGIREDEEKIFCDANLIPILNNPQQIKIWTKAAKKIGNTLKCSLQIDTGMTRTGIDPYLVETILDEIFQNQYLEICYILSHLACADEIKNKKNDKQLNFMQSLQKKYPNFKYSLSNSAGILLGKQYHFHQVRPGGIIYGCNPYGLSRKKFPISLLPVIDLSSKIIDIHEIKDPKIQETIGYGATCKLKPGMITATIPIGYGDGYPRSLSNKGFCYINNIKVNIIGQISMDLLCIDISNIPKKFQNIGQNVEIIGDNISIEEIANLANTINYEILTSLRGRYQIKYEYEGKQIT